MMWAFLFCLKKKKADDLKDKLTEYSSTKTSCIFRKHSQQSMHITYLYNILVLGVIHIQPLCIRHFHAYVCEEDKDVECDITQLQAVLTAREIPISHWGESESQIETQRNRSPFSTRSAPRVCYRSGSCCSVKLTFCARRRCNLWSADAASESWSNQEVLCGVDGVSDNWSVSFLLPLITQEKGNTSIIHTPWCIPCYEYRYAVKQELSGRDRCC